MGQRETTIAPLEPPRTDLATKTIKFEHGATYTGQVNEKNQKHGYGKLIWPGKFEYSGQFKDGHIHGFGKMKHENGTEYKGEYKNDKYDARGVLKYANWQHYKGEFKNGLRHGRGTFYNSDGTARHGGTYKNDKLRYCCGLCWV
jgi:hypothetical protein